MTTTTRTRKPAQRNAKIQSIGDATILWLTVDKNATAYRLTPLPHAYGKAAFHLTKADRGDGPGEEYDVLLDGQFSSCECKGFLAHNHCKHVEGLAALLKSGSLKPAAPAVPQPASAAKPAPQPQCEAQPSAALPAQENRYYCPECRRWSGSPFCDNCPI